MEKELSLRELQGHKEELVKDFKDLLQKRTQEALEIGALKVGVMPFKNLGEEEITIDEKNILLDVGNIVGDQYFLKHDGSVDDRVVLKSDGKLYRMRILVGRMANGSIAFWAPPTEKEVSNEKYLTFASKAIKMVENKISPT